MAHELATSLYILRCITKDSISLVCGNSLIPGTSSSNFNLCNTKVNLLGCFLFKSLQFGLPLGWSVFPTAEPVPIITHLCFSFPQIKGSTFTENHPSTNSMVKPAFLCVAFKLAAPSSWTLCCPLKGFPAAAFENQTGTPSILCLYGSLRCKYCEIGFPRKRTLSLVRKLIANFWAHQTM